MLGPLWRFRCGFAWQARGILHLAEREQTWGFCGISKNDGRRGAFEEDLQRCMSRGRRSTKHMCIRDVRRSGRWFPEKGCILEHQIFRFAKMILRPGFTFSWQAQYFRQMEWKKCKTQRHEAISSARNFPFLKEVSRNCFVFDVGKMRKSRRIASFLMLPTSKIEEVSQNCFLFDVTKFKSWGCLAE